MGLTIHYTIMWEPPNPPPDDVSVRRLVEEARRQIIRARLGRVTALRPADGGAFNGLDFAKVKYDPRDGRAPFDTHIEVKPVCGYLFTLDVGEDCEPATMGLCRYPEKTWAHGRDWPLPKLRGWRLRLFAKTQYASLHGWEHFRRCHLAILAALEIWRELGARVKISDEGGYWPRRSERVLRRELDMMNGIVAAAAGAMRDLAEDTGGDRAAIQSPILAHPQFERLEHEGQARVAPHVAALRRLAKRGGR